eukprot:XP_011663585.1 PREDICTED: uncharacterized protein LOC105438006 [Strongylocentrotus purpuratus]
MTLPFSVEFNSLQGNCYSGDMQIFDCCPTFVMSSILSEFNEERQGEPVGTYGLPKPNSGCPTGWSEGYRYHDTEEGYPGNAWSDPLDLDGTWDQASMEYKFCMKTQSSSAEDTWPAGSYCIYKKGDCPSGFVSGSITWDDENSRNGNRAGGTLPDGTYDHKTVIFFCCRSDGVTSQAISLPRGDFFLCCSHASTVVSRSIALFEEAAMKTN